MKKTILTLLLAAMSTGAMAEWVKVGESDSFTSYIDPATIRKDGNFRKAWILFGQNEPDKNGAMSLRYLFEYECKEGRQRILTASSHSEPMAIGKVLVTADKSSEWNYIAPGTIGETILKLVCKK